MPSKEIVNFSSIRCVYFDVYINATPLLMRTFEMSFPVRDLNYIGFPPALL